MEKIAGVGLVNLVVIVLVVWVMTIGAKSLAGQKPENPLSKLILTV